MENNLLSSTECANDTLSKNDCSQDTKIGNGDIILDEDMNINWKEKEPERFNSTDKIKDEISSKFEHESKSVLIRPEYIDVIGDPNADMTVKCEPLEFQDAFDVGEMTNVNSLFSTECADDTLSKDDCSEISCEDTKIGIGAVIFDEDTNVNRKEKELGTFNSADKINDEVSSKFEHQSNNLFIRPEYIDVIGDPNADMTVKCEPLELQHVFVTYIDDTGNDSFNDNGSEISCGDTKPDIGPTSRNFANVRSADVKHDKREESKNTLINRMKHKKGCEIKLYQCDICNKCFTTSRNLNIHKRTHTGEKPFKCDVCNKCFTSSNLLNIHKGTHTGDKPYKCDVCNKCFARPHHLKDHKRTHTGEKPYKCDVCNMCFTTSRNLNVHKRLHVEKLYKCDVCNKCFATSNYLNNHIRTHTGEKPYKCDVCNKCFTISNYLNIHKRTHTGEKPYECDICNKCFTSSSHLNIHKRTHTGVKPCKCDVCNKCFTTCSSLNNHKRIHTGEKPYKCDVCNRCFAYLHHLKGHKRIHTGEKPYQCNVCNKCYAVSSHLYAHKCVHTNPKP